MQFLAILRKLLRVEQASSLLQFVLIGSTTMNSTSNAYAMIVRRIFARNYPDDFALEVLNAVEHSSAQAPVEVRR